MVLVVQVEDKVRVLRIVSAEGVNAETRGIDEDLLLMDQSKLTRDMAFRYFIDGNEFES